ncbi:MAG TPA: glycine zipper 2TM domain-containing protein [Allosphingosinicella sp.]|jgi:outer membrane lipoprotein SlyB|uniref:glycine zipper 2TM domain-containing protein n=1 Tax=Allosphingosinicella sp. TaxID=2823234 RepID=UPI002F2A1E75
MRKFLLAASALTLTTPVIATSAAEAHRTGYRHSHTAQHQVYCQKRSGTTGLIVGGAAGVLAGREIDKRGSRTTASVLGGAVGALLGRHVERNVLSRRCR